MSGAPEAITQADRDDEQALYELVTDRGLWPSGEIRRFLARHRCLASHGAGEGLRVATEEWKKWAGEVEKGGGLRARQAVESINRIIKALDAPPSDAGSATREGGEVDEPCSCILSERTGDPIGGACPACVAAIATTPSPDASPDSGERASVIDRLTHCIAAQRAIINGPQYGTVETEAARLSYAAMLDARRLLTPSPEAPANRQEAGEVRLAALEEAALIAQMYGVPGGHVADTARGVATAIRARAALTSPKDVKGEGR